MLTGMLYSHLADSYMGLAEPGAKSKLHHMVAREVSPGPPRAHAIHMARTELCIDRSRAYFHSVGHVDGESEQLFKKAVVAKLRGDEKLAEEWAQNHNEIWKESGNSARTTF